jgi:hypothetical protein
MVPKPGSILQNIRMGNPIDFNSERVLENVRAASTEDLLNRVTAFREGMEPKALSFIETELSNRGVGPEDIEAHWEELRKEVILAPDGMAERCSFCHQPAVAQGWAWHRLWGRVPVFPRLFYYCREHRPIAD